MIRDLVMPQLSMGMTEGTVIEWAVEEGARIERDAPLASVETEKVVTEIACPYPGFVHFCAEIGKPVAVETVIARVAETESEYRSLTGGGEPASARPPCAAESVAAPAGVEAGGQPESEQRERVRASGLARKTARDLGVQLAEVTGSGPGGRIVRRDVLASAGKSRAEAPASGIADRTVISGVRARVPLTGMRRTIADRMVRSKATAAHTYYFFEIDVTKLVRVRETMLAREPDIRVRISMISLYAKALAIACRHVPICNATVHEEEIVVWDDVNIGVAVALQGKTEYESGLIVPVVRNVERMGVLDLDVKIKDLIDRARTGRLAPDETTGGTMTMSSTAGFLPGQWSVSTPLLNLPQVFNFQPGSPIEKPVVVDGQVCVRTMLPCGVSFDHRAVDGEPVGRFIRRLSELLSNPELMLL